MKKVIVLFSIILISIGGAKTTHSQSGTIPHRLYIPLVHYHTDPTPDREWDPRLDQRGAHLLEAEKTSGYWRLIKARWYDVQESGGRHHIFVDVRDANGDRMVGVPIIIQWDGGETTIYTEAKPGEEWAANFPMFAVAPAYSAQLRGESDTIKRMGLGSIEAPNYKEHTSYGLTWQWID